DLSATSGPEQEDRLVALRTRERAAGFDPARPPLLRITLVRLAPHRHTLITTYHHILFDGWSQTLVLAEVLDAYTDPESLPPVQPFGRYLAWLGRQDRDAARAAWRQALDGAEPTLVVPPASGRTAGRDADTPETDVLERLLPQELTARLDALCRRHDLTLNTLVQGVWATLLG
ncbi:non-ribosomal peptide synthetase, partial [Streptomyces lunaelactis]|uniref:condensation domain-containing protein n=1 Tax=Streptomyces lunaelactis TaxID=1535768 RepID=UPI001FEBAB59|nr:non-ribosomal peptide synthetase [Streptomyces lunaelactis]